MIEFFLFGLLVFIIGSSATSVSINPKSLFINFVCSIAGCFIMLASGMSIILANIDSMWVLLGAAALIGFVWFILVVIDKGKTWVA